MYKRGASVVMLCRSEEKANAAMKSIRDDNAEEDCKGSWLPDGYSQILRMYRDRLKGLYMVW